VFGAATMLSSLGMSLGPTVGGWVFDTWHNYAWLYIASATVGVAAVMLALLFPKPKPALA
jgi:MFS family permease